MDHLLLLLVFSLPLPSVLGAVCETTKFLTKFGVHNGLNEMTCSDTTLLTDFGSKSNKVECAEICSSSQTCAAFSYNDVTKSCMGKDNLFSVDQCSDSPGTRYYSAMEFGIVGDVEEKWITFGNKCYFVSNTPETFEASVSSCSNSGGGLLQFDSYRKHLFLKSLAKKPELQGSESCFGYLITGGEGIKDSQLSASSNNGHNHPNYVLDHTRARLNTEEYYDEATAVHYVGGWMGSEDEANSYVQVRLNYISVVNGVATQGRTGAFDEFVSSYSIEYSIYCQQWTYVKDKSTGDNQVFPGNNDAVTTVTNMLVSPITALCVRLHVLTYTVKKSLRFDLIGCNKDGPDTCKGYLISANPEEAELTSYSDASSVYPEYALDASRGTLFSRCYYNETDSKHYLGGWMGGHTGATYIQVRFKNLVLVRGIATQGRHYDIGYWDSVHVQYVSKYSVEYSKDCVTWAFAQDGSGNTKIFQGNSDDKNVVVTRMLDCSVVATCVRIHPVEYFGFIVLRFDILGCPISGAFRTGGVVAGNGQWVWTATGDPVPLIDTSVSPNCNDMTLNTVKMKYICEKDITK